MIRFLRRFMGRREEDALKELVNEVGRELGEVEKNPNTRGSDPNRENKGKEQTRN